VVRTVSITEARADLFDLLGTVHDTHETIIVERQGEPYAVVISPDQYERLHREQERAWATVDRIRARNADKAEEDVLADVTEEVEAVRRSLYAGA
jgi:antitoxin YefM